ncbi:MAG: FecR domain-containing protein [Candidatus Aceula meridiana]|nr:FecR domain-containing protein [Candidatus Aceula meridiana]
MKKIIFFLSLCCFVLCASLSFAQTAKIIDISGRVFVKESLDGEWTEASIGVFLSKDAALKTKRSSSCTLAFDKEMKNIFTIGENSQIVIEDVNGGVFLKRGRVFSLVDNASAGQKFEVRTPVAIAGARGTGWVTYHKGMKTKVLVFERTVSVEGEDGKKKDIKMGFGIIINPDGSLGEEFPLDEKDWADWKEFKSGEQDPRSGFGPWDGSSGGFEGDSKEDFRDFIRQKERESQESSTPDSPPDPNIYESLE